MRSFLIFPVIFLCAIVAMLPAHVRADQTDERLDGLLQELAHLGATGAQEEAQQKAQNIQTIWAQSANPTVMILQERIHQALGHDNLPLALELSNHMMALTPNLAHGWVLRASILRRQGADADCLAMLQKALLLEPRHFVAKWMMGNVMEAQGAITQAGQYYREALMLYPGWKTAQIALQNLQDRREENSGRRKI